MLLRLKVSLMVEGYCEGVTTYPYSTTNSKPYKTYSYCCEQISFHNRKVISKVISSEQVPRLQ
jgi:hypothetical protein